jgi:hypothetical protein
VPSDKYRYAASFLQSDARIESGRRKQEVGFVIVNGGIVNKGIHMRLHEGMVVTDPCAFRFVESSDNLGRRM